MSEFHYIPKGKAAKRPPEEVKPPAKMRITWAVGGYNQRRYGRPWIAKVSAWPVGKTPMLDFGVSLDAYNVEIEAEVGDVVRYGQKDKRGGKNTESHWGIVNSDGSIQEMPATEARDHWFDQFGKRAS